MRRYQNADGSLTPLGKRMADNRSKYGDSKGYKTGEARINRRLNKLENWGKGSKDLRDYASNSNSRRDRAMNRDLRKRAAMDILEDPNKLKKFGDNTRRNRVGYAIGGAVAFTTASFVGLMTTPVIGIPAASVAVGATIANEIMSRS